MPLATLIPHIYPVVEPGLPFFAIGLRPPRTPLGRGDLADGPAGARTSASSTAGATSTASASGSACRRSSASTAASAPTWRWSATFPQLEYPRRWPAGVEVTGPMTFEVPHPEIELPPGRRRRWSWSPPAPPTTPTTTWCARRWRRSPRSRCGSSRRPTGSRPQRPIEVPANAVLVDWLSYSQLMPAASLVISHGGHGTVARALGAGTPVLICPIIGDMSETAMRVAWAGAGLSLPWRLCRPGAAALGGAAAPRRPLLRRRAPASSPPGAGSTTAPSAAPSWSRSWPAPARPLAA